MSSILVVAKLVCSTREDRPTVLDAFHKIIEYTERHEPEVLRYVVTLPVEDSAGTAIYMIEEYADQAASDAHLATQPVKDLITLFTTSSVLAQPPEVHTVSVSASKPCVPPPAVLSDPAIVLVYAQYSASETEPALKQWNDLVEYVRDNEYWTKGFTVGEEEGKSCVRSVQVFEGWGAWEKVHLEGMKAKRLAQDSGVKGNVRVRFVDGFLARDHGKARLRGDSKF